MKGSQRAFRVMAILLALALVTGAGTAFAAEKTIKLTIGTGKPIDAGKWISTIRDYFVPEISKRVAEQTDYKIKWREAYSGSVAKAGAVLEAVEMGLVDIGLIVYPFEPAKLFLHNSCPGLLWPGHPLYHRVQPLRLVQKHIQNPGHVEIQRIRHVRA